MTINNLWLEPGRALVGVDSEGRDEQGKIHQVNKLLPMAHHNAVLCGSGTLPFIHMAWSALQMSAGDLDELAGSLNKLLPVVYQNLVTLTGQLGLSMGPAPEKQSCILCGWSPLHARMIAVKGEQTDTAAGFAVTSLPDGGYLQPWINDDAWLRRFAGLSIPDAPGAMGRHAQEQARAIPDLCPEIHAGGRFIVAELVRDRMTIAPACDLP